MTLEGKLNPKPKIETIVTPEGNSVSFFPERGGIITSIKLKGQEILYMDQETLSNIEVNVKGGVPVLFPNAGPIPDEIKTQEFANLKQHGFARESKWSSEAGIYGFTEILDSNQETNNVYPYNFKLSNIGDFEKDGSFTIIQEVKNLEENKELPVSFGLHPYFKIPQGTKHDVSFDFSGGEFVKENIEKWANGKAVSIDNPNTPMKVHIPYFGTLILTASPEYKKIWVWSLTDKDFICVEPVMRNKGGLILDPEKVKPNKTFSASFNIKLDANQS